MIILNYIYFIICCLLASIMYLLRIKIIITYKCISENKLAKISRESGNKATITWSPTVKEQLTYTENGVKGQFIVQYDVDHSSTPNQVLVCYLQT